MDPGQSNPKCSDTGVNTSCHGTFECLRSSSAICRMSPVMRVYQRFASYLTWWLENLGWRKTLNQIVDGSLRRKPGGVDGRGFGIVRTRNTNGAETLGLQPGELVEVKPIDEILATLNRERRCRGLLWMTGMRKYCGKQYRVRKRVERIMLETDGQLRTMKNTVLLEDVMCDGTAFGGCDRSCFHFWREAWLKRVPTDEDDPGGSIFSTTEDSHRSHVKNYT